VDRHADLLEVIRALRFARRFARLLNGWQH
jgi:hypothetical protein